MKHEKTKQRRSISKKLWDIRMALLFSTLMELENFFGDFGFVDFVWVTVLLNKVFHDFDLLRLVRVELLW